VKLRLSLHVGTSDSLRFVHAAAPGSAKSGRAQLIDLELGFICPALGWGLFLWLPVGL